LSRDAACDSLHCLCHDGQAKNNVLMISGPSPKRGQSFVSANLAALWRKTGQKSVLD